MAEESTTGTETEEIKTASPACPSIAEKLAQAREWKDKGNIKFKEGNFKRARICYSTVFAFTRGLSADSANGDDMGMTAMAASAVQGPAPTQNEETQIAEMTEQCHSNLAMVHLKLNEPQKAIEHCNSVLEIDPQNVKALFRKAKAQLKTGDLDNAKVNLTAASKLEPNSAPIRSEMRKLQQLYKKHAETQRRKYRNMFGAGDANSDEQRATAVSAEDEQQETTTAAAAPAAPATAPESQP